MPMISTDELAHALDRLSASLGDGMHATAIPGVSIVRGEAKSEKLHTLYRPSVCIIAQGAKRVIAGASLFTYAPGQYLTVSVELPVLGQIIRASPDAPYLCLVVELDPGILNDLMLDPSLRTREDAEPEIGLQVSSLSPDILDAASRLTRLLEADNRIGVLSPLYLRELAFLLLSGPQGARLRQMAARETRSGQIAKAIRWIAQHYREPISVEDAAAEANLGASAFYQHFKSVTALSPLQFQKQLRLQEARRMLVSERADAASVGFAVGYSSPQQFSREYARLFGAPPQRDAQRLRASGTAVNAAT